MSTGYTATRPRRAAAHAGIALGLIVLAATPGSARAAARIDAATRNRSAAARPVLVADGGSSKLPVVVSENASAATRASAEELAAYLERITGAKFGIQAGGDGPAIRVGTINEFPTPSAANGLRVYDTYDGKEAYAIRVEDGGVRLLGATTQGVAYAVARFLELAGCRWFFPSPAWEVVPGTPRLEFGVNETDRPEVLARYFGHPRGDSFEKDDPDAGAALRTWWRRNYVGKSLKTVTGHCAHQVVTRFRAEFEAHPEYRALLKDGTRAGDGKQGTPGWMWGQLCVSNPRVVELAVQYAREQLDRNPEADMVGVGPDDGGGWCTCPECARLGDPGNQAFYLANQVAGALRKSHPGKMAGLLAYNWHCDPPDFRLEPNVYVELTTSLLLNTKLGFDRLLEAWPEKCGHFGLYDYWAVYDWIRDRLPSGRTGNTGYVGTELPRYVRHGIVSLCAESGNSWGSQGLGYYLASRVLWNPAADIEALKDDFYEKAFGPAAAAMKAYYERVDLRDSPLVGPSFYRLRLDDLDRAARAAEGRPDVRARIEQLRQYHVYVYLFNRSQVKKGEAPAPEKRQDALDLLAWTYRTRNTYMTFWSFFADQTTKRMSAEYGEPSWLWYQMHRDRKADLIPYRTNGAAPDRGETDRWFEKMRAAYGDVPRVDELRFGGPLVLPKWSAGATAGGECGYPTNQGYLFQGYCPEIALASPTGGALRLTIRHGTLYTNMPAGEAVVRSPEGKELARRTLARGETRLELSVPGPGVYSVRYDDHSAGGALLPDRTQQGAFVLERGKPFKAYNYISVYFYVPKGTKSLSLYANKGGELFGVRQPDGAWAGRPVAPADPKGKPSPFRLVGDGSFMTIAVPDGMDGKVWSALGLNRGTFWFFNLPNVLSFSREGVLVPEEVARRDGLAW